MQLGHAKDFAAHDVQHSKEVHDRHIKQLENTRAMLEESIKLDQSLAEFIRAANLDVKYWKAHYENIKSEITHDTKIINEDEMREMMSELSIARQKLAESLRNAYLEIKK